MKKINKITNTISAIILTKNEEAIICDCLNSIKWVDEIVVIDSGSTDNTINMVNECQHTKIYESNIKGDFSAWRNLGAEKATGDWLFYIDADERCSPELASEIQSVINLPNITVEPKPSLTWFDSTKVEFDSTKHTVPESSLTRPVAYAVPRANIRLTKPLFHGGWWPDYVLRLMRKDSLIKWEGKLHEQPKVKGKIGRLKNHFIHLSHRGSLEHKVNTTIKYSITEAEAMFTANHPPMNLPRFGTAMLREFWKRMIKYQGWRDGLEGIMEVVYQVFSVFISYARLWELQKKAEINEKQII